MEIRNINTLSKSLNFQDFKRANTETHILLLKESNQTKRGWLDNISLLSISDSTLLEVDRLWKNHSNGKFGLSSQLKILKSITSKISEYDDSLYKTFSELVGWWISKDFLPSHEFFPPKISQVIEKDNGMWLKYDELNFNKSAPRGHLPFIQDGEVLFSLLSKFETIDAKKS